MFEQIKMLVSEKLGLPVDDSTKFNEDLLKIELDLIENISACVLELEVADEGQEVDPMETLRNNPNILFFRDQETGFLNTAIQTKKLIDQIVRLNVPTPNIENIMATLGQPSEVVTDNIVDDELVEE